MDDVVVRTVARVVIPFALLYGCYVVFHGHLSPGGGFPGGAVLGSAVVLYTLVYGLRRGASKVTHRISARLESGTLLTYVGVGLLGIIAGGTFLTNLAAGFPAGRPGSIVSAGMIPVISVIIGLKVGSTLVTLFHTMLGDDSEGS